MKRGPLRLRDDPSVPDELRELMAEPHAGPPKLDAATKAASIASVVAGAGVASASTVAAGTTATGVKLWLVIGGLCVGGVVAGVAVGTGGESAEPVEAARAPTVSPVAGPAVEAIAPEDDPEPAPEPELEPAEAEPAALPPAPTRPHGRAHEPAPSTGVDALRAEAALLESARALLESRPRAALRATREHAVAYPMGQLASEREMIAIEALQRLGRVRAAERRGRRLLRAHPTGIYADRVRRLLEDLASEP